MRRWHQHGASVVFTNGCFDLLHPGHVSLLHAAAQLGDKLVVAINSDASVRRLKGPTRPVQDEMARATVIRALRDVDMVVIFEEDTPLELITALQPMCWLKGRITQRIPWSGPMWSRPPGGGWNWSRWSRAVQPAIWSGK